jgi:uncharacterized protein YndB with AHSA1/START domain
MVNILHRVGVKSATLDDVYQTITTIEGLSGWWASDTTGDPTPGGVMKFRFGPGGFDIKVLETEPAKHVLWQVVEGPEEWIGTKIRWELKQEDDFAIILFKHEGWKEDVEFMNHCSTKWAVFLLSLKSLVETGTGAPDPRDVQVSNWH